MFNLLMTSLGGEWENSPAALLSNRLLEHTHESLRERFNGLSNAQLIEELRSYPVLFSYERGVNGAARVGWVERVQFQNRQMIIDFQIAPGLPSIPSAVLEGLAWELDIGEWEFNRTHWSVKDVDLFQVLLKAGVFTVEQFQALTPDCSRLLGLEQPAITAPIDPKVFRVPGGEREGDLVAVMMPFSQEFEPVFVAIHAACGDQGLRCQRVSDIWDQSELIQDIFALIYRASAVICDFSGQNPNVFYEAGIAHTLGRKVIPLVQQEEDVPFDLRHHRYLCYSSSEEGRAALRRSLALPLSNVYRGGQ